ncbi:MAG TPA: hypothetical protein VNL13_05275 [Sulfolobales archaeon]|nr:hypothetical protein [Sulfolobales archaeon]
METLRLPPRIKILEALGAIADNRVKIVSDREAIVVSSEGDRSYKVYIDLEERAAYSDDNGTRFRGYVGYPIVAVLMIKGALPFDAKIAEALKGVKWRQLNEKYKSYAIVEDLLLRELKTRSIDPEYVKKYISNTMSALARLGLRRKT